MTPKINPDVFLRAAEWLAEKDLNATCSGCCKAIEIGKHIAIFAGRDYTAERLYFENLFKPVLKQGYWMEDSGMREIFLARIKSGEMKGLNEIHRLAEYFLFAEREHRLFALLLAYEVAKGEFSDSKQSTK